MKNILDDRASITPFFVIVTTLIIIVGFIVFDYTFYKFNYSKQKVKLYFDMDKIMSGYNKDIFNQIGLIVNDNKKMSEPISNSEILEKQIEAIMDKKELVKTIYKAENLVDDFLKCKTKIKVKLFDVGKLNRELKELLNGEKNKVKVDKFILNLISVQPYVKLKGLSVNSLKEMLLEFKFEEIKAINPVFVIRDYIREKYKEILEAYKKYDILGTYKHYILADYSIEYLGYNMTKNQKYLMSEYIATGIESKSISRYVVIGEIYSIRLILNFSETFINPKIRKKIKKISFGDPRIFALEAITVSALESFYDSNRIINGGKIPLYKGRNGFMIFKFKKMYYKKGLTYPSYLKLIIMIHPKKVIINRINTLISKRFKVDSNKLYTKIIIKRNMEYKPKILPFKFKTSIFGELSYE